MSRVREIGPTGEKPDMPRWVILHFNGATGITSAMSIYAATMLDAIENCDIPRDLIYAAGLWEQLQSIGDQLAQVKVEIALHELNKH